MARLVALLFIVLVAGAASSENYGTAVRAMALVEEPSLGHWLEFPLIAYADDSCTGEAAKWVTDFAASTMEYFRDAITGEFEPFVVLDDTCLTIPGLTRGEANRTTSTLISSIKDMGIGDLRSGFGASTYDWLEVSVDAPNVIGVSYQVFNDDPGSSSLSFGYLFFEYRPDLQVMRIHQHRYVARRGSREVDADGTGL